MRLGLKSASEEGPVTLIHLNVSVDKRAVQASGSNSASSQGSWTVPASRDSLFITGLKDVQSDGFDNCRVFAQHLMMLGPEA